MRAIVSDAAAKGEHLAFQIDSIIMTFIYLCEPPLDMSDRMTLNLFGGC